jgi:hypothetical protein
LGDNSTILFLMKTINKILLLFIAFSAPLFTSCTTDIEPIDPAVLIPNPIENGQFKVDIDEQTFVATNVQAVVNASAIAITGLRSGNNDFIQITLPTPLNQVGTYTWTEATTNNVVLGLIYSNSASEGFISAPSNGDFALFPAYTDTAKVTVTSINVQNKTISGTFEFTGGRFNAAGALVMKKFTNGSFTNISFVGAAVNPSANNFFAKIDGTAFNPANISGTVLNNALTITGVKQNLETISLQLPSTITVGTYNFTTPEEYFFNYIKNTSVTGIFNAQSGSFTIISHDTSTKKIKGTFSFVAKLISGETTHSITDGTFDVIYQ